MRCQTRDSLRAKPYQGEADGSVARIETTGHAEAAKQRVRRRVRSLGNREKALQKALEMVSNRDFGLRVGRRAKRALPQFHCLRAESGLLVDDR
jgi:hypothetical protein